MALPVLEYPVLTVDSIRPSLSKYCVPLDVKISLPITKTENFPDTGVVACYLVYTAVEEVMPSKATCCFKLHGPCATVAWIYNQSSRIYTLNDERSHNTLNNAWLHNTVLHHRAMTCDQPPLAYSVLLSVSNVCVIKQ